MNAKERKRLNRLKQQYDNAVGAERIVNAVLHRVVDSLKREVRAMKEADRKAIAWCETTVQDQRTDVIRASVDILKHQLASVRDQDFMVVGIAQQIMDKFKKIT